MGSAGNAKINGAETVESSSALATFGRRLSHHTAIYALGAVFGFFFGIVNLAVLTRLLSLAEFGRLSLLLFFAAMLTLFYNAGSLQGTMVRTFGGGDDEGGEIAEDEDVELATDKRHSLATGMALTLGVVAAGTALCWLLAPFLAKVLVSDSSYAAAVRWAALSGAMGALWRLAQNVMRYERRPVAFVLLGAVRPAFVLTISITLVTQGHGVEGAVAGTAIGTAGAIVVAVLLTRRSYVVAYRKTHAKAIMKAGGPFIPVIAALWLVHHVDLYLLSLFSSESDVAIYRVASRIGAGLSYFVSAFLMAWMPLARSVVQTAAERERKPGQLAGTLLGYFVIAALWILLGLAVLADGLIRIAPGAYGPAAPLIPLVGLGFVAFGIFMVLYRSGRFQNKRRWYLGTLVGASAAFVPIAVILVPFIGAYGVAAGQIIVFFGAALLIGWKCQHCDDPLELPYRRILGAVAVALVLASLGLVLGPLLGHWRILLDITALVLFPVLVIAFDFFPRDAALRALKTIAPDVKVPGTGRSSGLRLAELTERERTLLKRLIVRREPPAEVAAEIHLPEEEILQRMVAALRRFAELGEPRESDAVLGAHLLSEAAPANRDAEARHISAHGVQPFDIVVLDDIVAELRGRRPWNVAAKRTPSPDADYDPIRERLALIDALAGLSPEDIDALETVLRTGHGDAAHNVHDEPLLERAGAAIRQVAGIPAALGDDAALAVYLASDEPGAKASAARAIHTHELGDERIDRLQSTARRIRLLKPNTWRERVRGEPGLLTLDQP